MRLQLLLILLSISCACSGQDSSGDSSLELSSQLSYSGDSTFTTQNATDGIVDNINSHSWRGTSSEYPSMRFAINLLDFPSVQDAETMFGELINPFPAHQLCGQLVAIVRVERESSIAFLSGASIRWIKVIEVDDTSTIDVPLLDLSSGLKWAGQHWYSECDPKEATQALEAKLKDQTSA